MAGPTPDLAPIVESLPAWLQSIITVAIGIGSIFAGAYLYVRRLAANDGKPAPDRSHDFVITSAALTEVAPFREMAVHLADLKVEMVEIRRLLQKLVALQEDFRQDRENEREVAARLDAALVKQAMRIGREPGFGE